MIDAFVLSICRAKEAILTFLRDLIDAFVLSICRAKEARLYTCSQGAFGRERVPAVCNQTGGYEHGQEGSAGGECV